MLGLTPDGIFGISIHALREEGDEMQAITDAKELEFLSTPSARRATSAKQSSDYWTAISIHALREEGDTSFLFGFV